MYICSRDAGIVIPAQIVLNYTKYDLIVHVPHVTLEKTNDQERDVM